MNLIKQNLSLAIICAFFWGCQDPDLSFKNKSSNISEKPMIIGGSEVSIHEFPFLINIWQNTPSELFNDHLCGGSLIHSKWVLTAAHCVLEDITDPRLGAVKTKDLNLFINSSKTSGAGGLLLKVKAIIVHPQFSWPHNDLALLELTEPVNSINPIMLNDKDIGNSKSMATVAGWGLIDFLGQTTAENLQKITVSLMTRSECALDAFVKNKGWSIDSDILCTKTDQNQKGACPGDSGGPLIQWQTTGAPVLIGVVSWGSACRGRQKNQDSDVAGFADVAHAKTWIESIIR